jgi:hypothetical protein
MLVIGATVVTTLSFLSVVVAGFCSWRPQAAKRNKAAKITNDVMTLANFIW